jgi:hypothetical protein
VGGITLNWSAPKAGGLTLLGYQIQRQIDGGPYQYLNNGVPIAASTTSYFDNLATIVSPGTHSINYKIAAVYTNQAVSAFAVFSTVSFPN